MPRALLIRMLPGFMAAISARPIMPMVSAVSGTCSVTMSDSASNSARDEQGLALPCGSLVVWSQ